MQSTVKMSDSEDPVDNVDDLGDDLFGDDDAGDALSEAEDALSDQELASDKGGDDRDRAIRATSEQEAEFREKLVAEVPVYRHRIPRSYDGSVGCHFQALFTPS